MLLFKTGKMNINKSNYEEFLIDFIEGNLKPELKKEMDLFLDAHPEIREEVESFEFINISTPKNITFDFKADLKQTGINSTQNISESNYEEYLIASSENDLSNNEEKELNQFLEINPQLDQTNKLYKLSKATPSLAIVFEDKKSLKKSLFIKRRWYYAVSAAASVLILISIFLNPFSSPDSITETRTALIIPENIETLIISKIDNRKLPNPVIAQQAFLKIDYSITPFEDAVEEIQVAPLSLAKAKIESISIEIPEFEKPKILFYQFDYIRINNISTINYASFDKKRKTSSNNIFKSLFGRINKNSRIPEGKIEEKPKVKVSALWALANIGLERINVMTGSNLSIPASTNRRSEEKYRQEETNPSDIIEFLEDFYE